MPDVVEDRWPVEHCDSPRCEARIVWAVTDRGKRMPVDADPSPADGNIKLSVRYTGPEPLATVLSAAARFGLTLRTSHFATCPDADRFRRRR